MGVPAIRADLRDISKALLSIFTRFPTAHLLKLQDATLGYFKNLIDKCELCEIYKIS
jgi:hypothetical protein